MPSFRLLPPALALLLAASLSAPRARAQAAVSPGEILLSEMNCVACHAVPPPVAARLASRQSPRLGAEGVRITPHHLRAFLEDPANAKPGTLMPDLLHGLAAPQKTEAAEALTHFLVSLQTADSTPAAGVNTAAIAAGRKLYHAVGCVQCHAPQELPTSAAVNPAAKEEFERLQQASVPLGPVAQKYSVAELARFLRDPLKARPSGRMPGMKLSESDARAIAMFLLREQVPAGEVAQLAGLQFDYYEADLPELPEFDRLTPTASGVTETFSLGVAARKNDIALRFRGSLRVEKEGDYRFWTRSDDGSRLFIDGSKVVENGGIHPAQGRDGQVKLSAGEHTIEVVYFDGGGQTELTVEWQPPGGKREPIPPALLSHSGQPMMPLGSAPFALDAAKVSRGAQLYAELQCASCHGPQPGSVAAAPLPAPRPLGELRVRQPAGCLSTKPSAAAAKYDLTDRQRVVLLSALQNQNLLAEPLDAHDRIKRTMTTLNCYACHQRDRRGGSDGLHREYLASVGEVDLGDEGRIPPHLNHAGAKLQREWIHEVLVKGASVRPYMATRMPQFGAANVGHLPALFEEADARPEAAPQPDVFAPGMAADAGKFGRKLIGTSGLSCVACHNFAGNASLGVPALDLATSGQRLKWDWFRRYLIDPQALRPGTRMPSFWPGGVAINKDALGGDTEKQILSIWAYLARKNFTDLPPGLVMGRQEILPQGREAVIYRNFIDGAGPRAIGVGYPEKANLAFDADGGRLALIWQGAFIDAARHRTGRGQGFEKPLGTDVVQGPPGPAFALLESESTPWPKESGKSAGYQFQGYRLDAQRRPTFRYRLGQVQVEDFPEAVASTPDAFFRRTLTLRAADAPTRLYFRAAVANRIVEKDGIFEAGETLRLKFPGARPLVRNGDGGKQELLVPVTFIEGTATLVQEIVW